MQPDEWTNHEVRLPVGDGHELYVQDWGLATATTPIMYLHGGPGSGLSERNKRYFNPEKQRVIFHDQRGSGASTPTGSIDHNTTDDVIADMVKILDHFGIQKCVLTGGSWGAALAFFFAIAHPERVQAMVLNGIWTSTKVENDWIERGGPRHFYPDIWETYAASVPPKYIDNPSEYHFPRILGDDEEARIESGFAYESMEGGLLFLDDRQNSNTREGFDYNSIRIEVHYLANQCFRPDGFVQANAAKLTMPISLVQGRYDMVCPPITAYNLSKILPNADLYWTSSGHAPERETWSLIRALCAELTKEA